MFYFYEISLVLTAHLSKTFSKVFITPVGRNTITRLQNKESKE